MNDNSLLSGQIKGFPLIKLQSREIIEKMQKGSFYMNSLAYYRKIYKNNQNNVVGDPNEGKFLIHSGIASIESLGAKNKLCNFPFSTEYENDCVFCMFGINPEIHNSFVFTEQQKIDLVSFNDTALLITNTIEFDKRVNEAAKKAGYVINNSFVNYFNPSTQQLEYIEALCKYGIDKINFFKTESYKYQQEFRYVIHHESTPAHIELNIGDISDISQVLTKEQLLSSEYVALTSSTNKE